MPDYGREQIHIVPVGSTDPIASYMAPLDKYSVSKVIFLLGKDDHRPDEEDARRIVDGIISDLPEKVTYEIVYSDLFDFMDVVRTMSGIIQKEKAACISRHKHDPEKEPKFFINAASSTRVVTMASYIIAAHMPAHVYYTKVFDYSEDASMSVEDIIEIPIMPGQSLTADQAMVLKTINMYGPFNSLKDLIRDGLNDYTGAHPDPGKKKKDLKKFDYDEGSTRNKFSKVVQYLESSGFIETDRRGSNKKKIILTPTGKIMADIYDVFNGSEKK